MDEVNSLCLDVFHDYLKACMKLVASFKLRLVEMQDRFDEEDRMLLAQRMNTSGKYRFQESTGKFIRRKRPPKIWMSLQTVTPSWYENVLLKSSDDSLWIHHLRLPEHMVNTLCEHVKDDLSSEEITVREPIPLKKRVCIALYKLASCCEYRVVAATFGVSKTSVCRYVRRFCIALSRRKSMFIKWFSLDEALAMAKYIETNYKYPQAIGAIDGSHIPVSPPADGKSDYICRKGYPSIVLQAVADGHYMFRDVYANTAGAAHDAAVFNRSPLSTSLRHSMPKNDRMLGNTQVPLHILGDPAYPLSDLIMKGYVGRNLTDEQESFNVYHSSARMCIEIAFGRLKSRWRMLQKRMDVETSFAPLVITSCCILHNICEELKVPMPTSNVTDGQLEVFPQPPTQRYRRIDDATAKGIRDGIKNYLAQTQPLRKSFH